MFLREIPKSKVANIDIVDKEKLSKREKYLQKIREQLGARFRIEYLGQLRQQSIKNYENKPVKVGEIVLLDGSNKKRTHWNLARVLKLIPGRDGNARLVLVKTQNYEFLRSVQRLYRLEIENPVVKDKDNVISLATSSGRVVKPLKLFGNVIIQN
ncbi:hypothetical protein AVEN_172815-1 [Araneus ventricosus]|uniref:DUF5641 domain-containing protein n=1 Tax=Araneus ventricosus TaxID=182803 RepID=A0A4Y2BI33_ARAVE|nr:hypothetical protein AVEN_172815-1 [Araneus ventricosus]